MRSHFLRAAAGNVPSGYDPITLAYVAAVEAADGAALETVVKDAINTFVLGIKADYGFSAFHQILLLAGPRSLDGVCVNLTGGTNGTHGGFVIGDLTRSIGLVGGTSKRIGSGYFGNTCPQNSSTIAIQTTVAQTGATTRGYCGTGAVNSAGGSSLGTPASSQLVSRSQSGTGTNIVAPAGHTLGFIGMTRTNSANYVVRLQGGSESTLSATSQTPTSLELIWFARGTFALPTNNITATLGIVVYANGMSSMAALETHMNNYINTIAASGI